MISFEACCMNSLYNFIIYFCIFHSLIHIKILMMSGRHACAPRCCTVGSEWQLMLPCMYAWFPILLLHYPLACNRHITAGGWMIDVASPLTCLCSGWAPSVTVSVKPSKDGRTSHRHVNNLVGAHHQRGVLMHWCIGKFGMAVSAYVGTHHQC